MQDCKQTDPALDWLSSQLTELKQTAFAETPLAQKVTLVSCWLWMDERFDSRLDGLLGAILMTWKHCGRLPVSLLVNRVTDKLRRMSDEYGIHLIVDPQIKGGGGSVRDLNRTVLTRATELFDTEYELTFQDHAFPLRPGLEEFIGKWDYIAAPWKFNKDDWITRLILPQRLDVGNGAFSLRSRNLCERTAYYYKRHFRFFPHCYLFNDDYFIGKTLPSWKRNYLKEVRIADPESAARFAFEENSELQERLGKLPFGFHGPKAFNSLMVNYHFP